MPKKQKLNSPLIEFIQNAENAIIRNIQTLRSQLELHSAENQVQCDCIKYENAKMYFNWASEYYQNFELVMQGTRPPPKPNPDALYSLSDESLILRSFNLNSSINNQLWEPVILPSFVLLASKAPENERQNILKTIIKLIGGYFFDSKVIEQIKGDLIEFRTLKVDESEKWILFTLEVNCFPVSFNSLLNHFNYVHLLKIIDLTDNITKSLKSASTYLQEIKGVPEFWVAKNDVEGLLINAMQIKNFKTSPANYRMVDLNPEERSQYHYIPEIKRWRKGQKQKVWSQIARAKSGQNNENEQILYKLSSVEYCAQFNRVMEKLKSYEKSSKLSDEEKEIISTACNSLIIGRSGTGKTTSAILRMFATDVVFKKLRKISSFRAGTADSDLLTVEDVNKKEDIHQIFITLSPILTREVERLYQNLNQHLRCSIRKVKFEEIEEGDLADSIINIDEDQDVNLPKSFLDFNDDHFPAFIPVFNFLTRVDATLDSPFFAQGKENTEGYFGYHQKKIGMKMRYIETPDGPELVSTFNIDFKYFKDHFWPRIRSLGDFSAITTWTEISSAIKGSADAYKNNEGHITKDAYLGLGKKQSQIIDSSKRAKIWDIFMQYEAWKEKQNAYDFQDLINYVLRCIDREGYSGSPMHFTFIDEVQDCSTNFLLLILKITGIRLFFAGDTAQSISRGAGFRFCDLNSLFLDAAIMTHSQPIIKHLSVNFRSHRGILDIANLLIQLMVSFFPNSIDRLNKETSYKDGEKPIIVKSIKGIEICINKSSNKRNEHIEFGWNQVILVRTSESRKKLPSFLNGAICLTILESKGLEFNDVILYNFFTDSEVDENEWGRLEKYLENDPNEIKKMRDGMKKSLLCSELKHLYVGITRAKKRLIFYDEDDSCRASFERCLEAENLVRIVDSMTWSDIAGTQDNEAKDTNQWKKQGLKLYSQGNYERAKLCFERTGNETLVLQSTAKIYAEDAKKVRLMIASIEEEAKEKGVRLTKAQKESNKIRIQETLAKFKKAADLFNTAGDIKEAAECYSSAEDYVKAAELYIRLGMSREAGLAFYKNKSYEAAEMCLKHTQEYVLYIKCSILSGHYEQALESYQKYFTSIQPKQAKLLLQSIIRGWISGCLPIPFSDSGKNNFKFISLYDSFEATDLEIENYLKSFRHLDELVELSKMFQEFQWPANYILDERNLFIILKQSAIIMQSIQQNSPINNLYNEATMNFIRTCQPDLPSFLDLFSVKYGLEPLAPLLLLLDSFSESHTRICMLLANTLRFADLSCWYLISFVFKLSKPFISNKTFKKGSCLRYRSVLTALMFLDEEFYDREILGFGLAISGFWKVLKLIPENSCKNLINLYFLDSKEYNKFLGMKYFKDLKPLKILEQLIISANLKNNFTLKVNFESSNFSNEGYFKNIREIANFNNGNELYDINKMIDWIKDLFYGPTIVFDRIKINNLALYLRDIEYCAALSLLLMSSKEIPLNEIKLHLNVAEMEAFIFVAENIIKLLLGIENVISPPKRNFILESILLPLGITIITPDKYTRLLPFSTHVVMSRMYIRSHLLLSKNDKRIYSFDIEGNYWLVPKDLIFKDIAKSILHSLSELIYERSQYRTFNESGRQFELSVSSSKKRKLEEKIEYRVCILGEIYMLNKIIDIFNSCGEKYKSKFGGWTSVAFTINVGNNLGNLPFPCINITKASKEVLKIEANKILNSSFPSKNAFRQLRNALLFSWLSGEVAIYSEFVSKSNLQYIKGIGGYLYDLYNEAYQGNPEGTCRTIFEFLNKYKRFIPQQEIPNLTRMYCAYALLTCSYSFIPFSIEKNFYYYYPIEVFQKLHSYIINPQDEKTNALNISLIKDFIKIYRGDENCLSKRLDSKFTTGMFYECLTLIINSTEPEEHFYALTNLDLEHKDSIYKEEGKLEEIFYNRTFNDEELKYLYNETGSVVEMLRNWKFASQIGNDLLKFCDIESRENAPFDNFDYFSKGNYNQYNKFKKSIERMWTDTLYEIQSILSQKNNSEMPDTTIIKNIVRIINEADGVFNMLYGKSFVEDSYSDWSSEGINQLAQVCLLEDEEGQAKPIYYNQSFNRDDGESSTSESELEEDAAQEAPVADPIDEVTFNEENIKLDEGIDEEDTFIN